MNARTWLRMICPTVLAATPALLAAAEPDTSRWQCSSCVAPEGWEQRIDVGGIYVSDGSAKFGEYTGLDSHGGYLDLNLDVRRWGSDGRYLELTGENLGLDSRFIGLQAGRQGAWSAEVYWDELPQFRFDRARSPMVGAGSPDQTLPDGWVRAGSTALMTELGNSLQPQDIERERDTLGLGFEISPWANWTAQASFRRQERSGNTIAGGSFLTAATQLVQPLDDKTDEVEVGAIYAGKGFDVRVGYYGSFYSNDNSSLTWETPFNPLFGVESGALSDSPDSDFNQVSISGGWQVLSRTTLNGHLAVGRMTQDATFLPYAVNLDPGTLPRRNFDGEVDTTNADLRLTTRPWRWFRFDAEYRYDERDNGSPQDVYQYVITDVALGQPLTNIPYGYERSLVKASGEFRLPMDLRLSVGVDDETMTRDYQERRDTDTQRLWAKLAFRWAAWVDGYALYANEDRDGSSYQTLADLAAPQNPLMRKYNMADRNRDLVELRLSSSPTEMLTLGFTGRQTKDDYKYSLVGLTDAEDRSVSVDASFALTETASVYGAYTWEDIESNQAGSQLFASPDWQGDVEDRFDTVVAGLRIPKITDRLGLDLDYSFSRSGGDAGSSTAATLAGFPELRTRFHSVHLNVDYAWRDNLKFRLGYWFESYSSDDWSRDGLTPDTVPNLLALGAELLDYDVNTVFLSFTYQPLKK